MKVKYFFIYLEFFIKKKGKYSLNMVLLFIFLRIKFVFVLKLWNLCY